jgi:hypothetical protein
MSIPEVKGQHIQEVARPERRGVSTRTVVEEAKAKVSTLDLADLLCGPGRLRRVGERWVARCPLPGHEDRSPSFTVYPETDSFFCFGCLEGGDVIELARHAWEYDKAEVATAAAMLLIKFGHEVPQRPPSWFARQERQRSVRDRIDAEKVEHIRMLVFRLIWMPWLRQLPEWVREEATESAWVSSRPIALRLYEQRRGA